LEAFFQFRVRHDILNQVTDRAHQLGARLTDSTAGISLVEKSTMDDRVT